MDGACMTVRVVLEFEDEEAAAAVCKSVVQKGGIVSVQTQIMGDGNLSAAYVHWPTRLMGIFKRPTKYCDETDGHRTGKKTHQAWTRTKNYGWWVCSICHKPTEAWAN